jgi:hypothetical protein
LEGKVVKLQIVSLYLCLRLRISGIPPDKSVSEPSQVLITEELTESLLFMTLLIWILSTMLNNGCRKLIAMPLRVLTNC